MGDPIKPITLKKTVNGKTVFRRSYDGGTTWVVFDNEEALNLGKAGKVPGLPADAQGKVIEMPVQRIEGSLPTAEQEQADKIARLEAEAAADGAPNGDDDAPSLAESALYGASDALSFGLDAKIAGGMHALGNVGFEPGLMRTEERGFDAEAQPAGASDVYARERDAFRQQSDKAYDDNPATFLGAGVLSTLPLMFIPGSQATNLSRARKAVQLAKAGRLARYGTAVREGAVVGAKYGAASAAGHTDYDQGQSMPDFASELAGNMASGTLMGGTLGALLGPMTEFVSQRFRKAGEAAVDASKAFRSGSDSPGDAVTELNRVVAEGGGEHMLPGYNLPLDILPSEESQRIVDRANQPDIGGGVPAEIAAHDIAPEILRHREAQTKASRDAFESEVQASIAEAGDQRVPATTIEDIINADIKQQTMTLPVNVEERAKLSKSAEGLRAEANAKLEQAAQMASDLGKTADAEVARLRAEADAALELAAQAEDEAVARGTRADELEGKAMSLADETDLRTMAPELLTEYGRLDRMATSFGNEADVFEGQAGRAAENRAASARSSEGTAREMATQRYADASLAATEPERAQARERWAGKLGEKALGERRAEDRLRGEAGEMLGEATAFDKQAQAAARETGGVQGLLDEAAALEKRAVADLKSRGDLPEEQGFGVIGNTISKLRSMLGGPAEMDLERLHKARQLVDAQISHWGKLDNAPMQNTLKQIRHKLERSVKALSPRMAAADQAAERNISKQTAQREAAGHSPKTEQFSKEKYGVNVATEEANILNLRRNARQAMDELLADRPDLARHVRAIRETHAIGKLLAGDTRLEQGVTSQHQAREYVVGRAQRAKMGLKNIGAPKGVPSAAGRMAGGSVKEIYDLLLQLAEQEQYKKEAPQ